MKVVCAKIALTTQSIENWRLKMSVIYKLTHYTKTNGIENNCEEKYFSNFLKLKKFLKEKNISVCKKNTKCDRRKLSIYYSKNRGGIDERI